MRVYITIHIHATHPKILYIKVCISVQSYIFIRHNINIEIMLQVKVYKCKSIYILRFGVIRRFRHLRNVWNAQFERCKSTSFILNVYESTEISMSVHVY